MPLDTSMSKIVANRKEFHSLVEEIEHLYSCSIDDKQLENTIDADYCGMDIVSEEQAKAILKACSRPMRKKA